MGPDMDEPLRAVLAEDNLLVRQGLCSLLAVSGVVEVLAACSSLPELLEAVETHHPDVVLTDIRMPPGFSDEGIQAARLLRQSHPDLGVVVISQFADASYAMAVLGDGSSGRAYILKDRVHDLDRLLRAIRAVVAGGSFVDEEIVDVLVRAQGRLGEGPPTPSRTGSGRSSPSWRPAPATRRSPTPSRCRPTPSRSTSPRSSRSSACREGRR